MAQEAVHKRVKGEVLIIWHFGAQQVLVGQGFATLLQVSLDRLPGPRRTGSFEGEGEEHRRDEGGHGDGPALEGAPLKHPHRWGPMRHRPAVPEPWNEQAGQRRQQQQQELLR